MSKTFVRNVHICKEPKGNLRALVSICYKGIIINNISVIEGPNGLYIMPPSSHKRNPDGTMRHDKLVVFRGETEKISKLVLDAYSTELGVSESV